MESSESLIAAEEILIAVQCSNQTDVELIQAEAYVDLTKFDLTPQEFQKFQLILKELNIKLAESLQARCLAASVFSEVRSKFRMNACNEEKTGNQASEYSL